MSFTEAVRQHYIEAIKGYYGPEKAAKILNTTGTALDKRLDFAYLIDCVELAIDTAVSDLEDTIDWDEECE